MPDKDLLIGQIKQAFLNVELFLALKSLFVECSDSINSDSLGDDTETVLYVLEICLLVLKGFSIAAEGCKPQSKGS